MAQTYTEFAEELALKGRGYADRLVDDGKLEWMGTGIGRITYADKRWPCLVFKIEFHEEPMSNQSEWMYWQDALETQRKFLARPYYLSKNGTVLVMERCGSWDNVPDELWPSAEVFVEMEAEVGEVMWDAAWDRGFHNIGPSGTGPKLYDYADRYATFWFEHDGPYRNLSYMTNCDCPDCVAYREQLV